MAATGRRRPTTTERGLGYSHQQARRKLLAALTDGDPCARCAASGVYHPLFRSVPARLIEVDDFPARSVARALGIEPVKALSYKSCNRRAGAILGNKIKKARRAALGVPSRRGDSYDRW